VAALCFHGAPPGAPPCDTNQFHSADQPPGHLDYTMLHELMHALGFVPTCAPHFTLAGHVSDSPNDLMYAGSLPWNPTTLDVGHDDYFDGHVPGCRQPVPRVVRVRFRGDVRLGDRHEPATGYLVPDNLHRHPGAAGDAQRDAGEGRDLQGLERRLQRWRDLHPQDRRKRRGHLRRRDTSAPLSLRIHASRAFGTLRVGDGYAPCGARMPVVVQRRGAGRWTAVRHTRTTAAGSFAVTLPGGRGSFRAVAPEATVRGAQCAQATSPVASTG
jgi:hypothetical protein